MWSVPESASERTDWPASDPPPWPARVRATLWWHRSTSAARELGPEGGTIPMTLAMMVDYLDSPVGPYREILASPVLRAPGRRIGPMPRMAVPFIAVDSESSVHGGRTHWELPKVLAQFDGDVLGRVAAKGDGWQVNTTARAKGPRLPIVGALGFAQPTEGGRLALASARLTGRFRYARVDVESEGSTLPNWLLAGSHHGIVITDGKMRTGPAKRV
ncbi:hypothetical protein CJ178_22855 [Rhodococcus sp. ACPA4]|uniref:hypothetical protein n=1 Tax=unclassified Rhodococcus (in: high G+C Gram-positive bacteria) TaxID=192944 RepID=UPI000BB0CF0A|nr:MULTISPECIES: hypothetical protein [unclassified Rhodococcus (in: high G+C Gram-positive bacteria)]PBC44066.1 hypothetical protein CJ178_22855 [Rhodococcus sp. ACPA4]RZL21939.1 MAG: hypothetical protein EOP31_25700 [Rhodococcus sp. (in: high G+C Gram-positive bacteria)]